MVLQDIPLSEVPIKCLFFHVILQLVFADVLQNKIFVTKDQGETFSSYELDFTPNRITFQGRGVPLVTEGDLPLHILGYDDSTQEVCLYNCVGWKGRNSLLSVWFSVIASDKLDVLNLFCARPASLIAQHMRQKEYIPSQHSDFSPCVNDSTILHISINFRSHP